MKKILLLLVLLTSGCATHRVYGPVEGIHKSEQEEHKDFFYRSWLPHWPTPEEREDNRFFYHL